MAARAGRTDAGDRGALPRRTALVVQHDRPANDAERALQVLRGRPTAIPRARTRMSVTACGRKHGGFRRATATARERSRRTHARQWLHLSAQCYTGKPTSYCRAATAGGGRTSVGSPPCQTRFLETFVARSMPNFPERSPTFKTDERWELDRDGRKTQVAQKTRRLTRAKPRMCSDRASDCKQWGRRRTGCSALRPTGRSMRRWARTGRPVCQGHSTATASEAVRKSEALAAREAHEDRPQMDVIIADVVVRIVGCQVQSECGG